MSRGSDPGLATLQDWSGKREQVLEQAQSGIANAVGGGGNQVFIDLVVGDRSDQPMRLVFMLFEQTPLAFANFHALCAHSISGLGESGHPLVYRRCRVTRLVRGCFFEAGDITLNDGRGGDSIYGAAGFEREPFGLRLRHDAAGLLTMAPRYGKLQSRFRVLLGPQPQLDGECCVIGRLVSGGIHLPTIDALPVDTSESPARPLTIIECGPIPYPSRDANPRLCHPVSLSIPPGTRARVVLPLSKAPVDSLRGQRMV